MQRALQNRISIRAIFVAWLTAGSLFLVAQFVLMPAFLDTSADLVLPYMASLILGPDVLLDATTNTLLVGVLVHYGLSLIYTLLIVLVVHRWGLLIGLIGGAILGLAIYAINFYALTRFFEWFFAINSNVLMISHVIFGMLVGGIYELFDFYDLPIVVEDAG